MGGKSKEVINISSSNRVVYVNNTYFAAFEHHIKGIGMKLLAWMGYEGGHLRINSQGITNPIKVKEIPRYEGLGYRHRAFRECSKLSEAKKSSEDDMSHQDGSNNGNLSPKRDECFKGLCISSSSPHHQIYIPTDRYKCHGNFPNVGNFLYL